MESPLVVAFGEVLWDLLPGEQVLGGAPFNFAYRLHTLGIQSVMISRLGRDELGQRAWQQIQACGMTTAFIQRDSQHPTGTVKVQFDAHQNPEFTIIPNVAYDFIEPESAWLDSLAGGACLCFGTLIQRTLPSRKSLYALLAAMTTAHKFLDLNLRKDCYSPGIIQDSLAQATILKLNETELRYLAQLFHWRGHSIPDWCARLSDQYHWQYCLVTLGENGVYATTSDLKGVYLPGYRVPQVDSVGSGDVFSAGFISQLLQGQSFQAALEFGNIMGALNTARKGATAVISPQELVYFQRTPVALNYHPEFLHWKHGSDQLVYA
ncbi:carbohydrate kinase [candidate division KSB1 bacterium]|nr:carbohydrate kinase [candidate division KSB1 bacterium]